MVDTLALARRRHPGSPVSLDALCSRYGIDNSRRTKHGALLDSEILAEVYAELTGGRQTALVFAGPVTRGWGGLSQRHAPRPAPSRWCRCSRRRRPPPMPPSSASWAGRQCG